MLYNENVSGKMDFTPKEMDEGRLTTFVNFLISMGCEIRLATDGYCYIVEYLEPTKKEYGVEFSIVDYSQSDLIGKKTRKNRWHKV